MYLFEHVFIYLKGGVTEREKQSAREGGSAFSPDVPKSRSAKLKPRTRGSTQVSHVGMGIQVLGPSSNGSEANSTSRKLDSHGEARTETALQYGMWVYTTMPTTIMLFLLI